MKKRKLRFNFGKKPRGDKGRLSEQSSPTRQRKSLFLHRLNCRKKRGVGRERTTDESESEKHKGRKKSHRNPHEEP